MLIYIYILAAFEATVITAYDTADNESVTTFDAPASLLYADYTNAWSFECTNLLNRYPHAITVFIAIDAADDKPHGLSHVRGNEPHA